MDKDDENDDDPRNSSAKMIRKKDLKIEKPHVQTSKFGLFCEASSVRGMQKIYKSQTTFLKSLWIAFVFFMTTLLIIISSNLVVDFRNYHTAWHITTELDEKTRFPALSVCSHNPFSIEANSLWKEGKILTPEIFRKRLFEAEIELVKSGSDSPLSLFDKADEYYGNVDYESSIKLGHKREILKYCVVINDGFTIIAENCLVENDTGFTVSKFSHYNFFNCFTIEAKSKKNGYSVNQGDLTNETVSLIVLIKVNLFGDLYRANKTFVMDSLTRGEGLRLVVHQVGTYPDIDKNGINIQPGKMNEITFQNVHWTRYSSPKRECRDNQNPIVDLDRVYEYTFTQCLDAALNRKLIEKCKCMSTIWPRPQKPNHEVPYCNNYSGNLTKILDRLNCVDKEVLSKLKSIKAAAVGTECLPICRFNSYDTTLSITRWQPSMHKLRQITTRYRSVNQYLTQLNLLHSANSSSIEALKNNYIKELNKELMYYNELENSRREEDEEFNEHQMNYVSLVRKNFDTTKQIEKLVIDIYIFISRVGGLCSLCIGLTTAFFVELVEFTYLCISTSLQKKKRTSSDKNLNDTVSLQLQQKDQFLYRNNFFNSDYDKKDSYWREGELTYPYTEINTSLFSPNLNTSKP